MLLGGRPCAPRREGVDCGRAGRRALGGNVSVPAAVDGRPNLLLLMADQLPASALGCYGNRAARTPNLDGLARAGRVFENAYCSSPICAASRASLMAGALPSRLQVYDNGADFAASTPTICHPLRGHGYRTTLCGKMHFIGPDQLHGFEERLTPDIYPAGLGWTPDWGQGVVHNPGTSVRELGESGTCARSLQLDYDEAVAHQAEQYLYDAAREPERPFFLCASFTHPHDPFVMTPEYLDRFGPGDVPPPLADPEPLDRMHPYARWVQIHHELDLYPPSPEVVARARHAYYAMVSYLDAKVGQVLAALERAGLAGRTLVLFTSDHGEMLGEHGMWYKRVFYEDSARVPLVARGPGVAAGTCPRVVSLLDLLPTLCDAAQAPLPPAVAAELAGHSLVPLLAGRQEGWRDEAVAEYLGEGVIEPCRMLRRGRHKLVEVRGLPGQLFDLEQDPLEQEDLWDDPRYAALRATLLERLAHEGSLDRLHEAVVRSQARRRAVGAALEQGRPQPWDYVPPPDTGWRYVRAGDAMAASRRRRLGPSRPDGG